MSPKFRRPALVLSAFLLAVFGQPVLAQDAVRSQPAAKLITAFAASPASTGITSNLPAGPTLAEATAIEKRAFDETNIVRVKNGLPPFIWEADVCRMARAYSEQMSKQKFFAHVTPEGLRLPDRARLAGILRYSVVGENIAYIQGYEDPGALAVERWMLSPKHRANILSRDFRVMAIGSFVAPDGSIYLTQTFLKR